MIWWHGLNRDEPLTVEGIIRSAFSNPNRTKYPNFAQRFDWSDKLCHSTTAESLIQKIENEKPNAIFLFDIQEIRVYDVSKFWEKENNDEVDGAEVDTTAYLRTIKRCRWCGPYISNDECYFYSIDGSGVNEHFLTFVIEFSDKYGRPTISLYYNKNINWIRDQQEFYD